MKKLLLTIFILSLACTVYASAVKTCTLPNTSSLPADSGAGLSYSGLPIRWGTDGVGYNNNYLNQVYLKLNSDGSSRVQISVAGKNTNAYNTSKVAQSPGSIGISTITFQDSGIVMPRAQYAYNLLRDIDFNCSWLIVGVYNLNAVDTVNFRLGFAIWNTGKLPKTQITGTEEYYWK